MLLWPKYVRHYRALSLIEYEIFNIISSIIIITFIIVIVIVVIIAIVIFASSRGRQSLATTAALSTVAFVTIYIMTIIPQVRGQMNRGDDDDERQLMDENPIIVLMEFGKLMGFRLMDLFAALDKDGSKSLDHQEIREGLRVIYLIL